MSATSAYHQELEAELASLLARQRSGGYSEYRKERIERLCERLGIEPPEVEE